MTIHEIEMLSPEHLESDIGVAAYLKARGFRLLGLERIGPSRYAFRFADPNRAAEQDAQAYFTGALAEAKRLLDALRDLKDLLYAQKGNRNGNCRHPGY